MPGREARGLEARMNRLIEACETWYIDYDRLLAKAAIAPAGDLVGRMEWAFEAITGHKVPKKSPRWKTGG